MNPPGRCEHCQRYHPPEQLRCAEFGVALPLRSRVLGGRYELQERIGLSATARVWRARHRITGGAVAVKLLRPELLDQKVLLDRFVQEGELGARVQSDEVTSVLDLGQSEIGPFLVMEWVPGESLKERVEAEYPQSGPWSFSKILSVAVALARAICAVHAQGIIHRDIKASNVMVYTRPDGELALKLGDFGVAKSLGGSCEHSMAGQILGTPRYMPPEQRADPACVDERADLYAFALTVVWMLEGPSADLDSASWKKNARRKRWPPGLLSLLQDCTAQQPVQRPASALEVLQRLRAMSRRGAALGPSGSEAYGPDPRGSSRSFAMLLCALGGAAGGYAAAELERGRPSASGATPRSAGLWLDQQEAKGSPRCVEAQVQGTRDFSGQRSESPELQVQVSGGTAVASTAEASPKRKLRAGAGSKAAHPLPELLEATKPSLPSARASLPAIRRPSKALAPALGKRRPGLIAAGDLYTLAARVTAMGFFDARQYCRSLAESKHLGLSSWRLAKTAQMARWSHVPGVRFGLYWTDDLQGSRAQVVGLPSNRRFHARLRRRFIRPFCVADRSRK